MQFEALTARVEALLSSAAPRPVLVALDGRCGSGKTTLAVRLAGHFPGSRIIHTDDFYLPPAARHPGWETTPCANMDLERLYREVLVPAQAGRSFQYRAFSCKEGRFLPAQSCPAAQLVLIEGSYSHHPALAACYGLRVFVTCLPDEQRRRLQTREGERYAAFAQRWIPLEEAYFSAYRVEEQADVVFYG